MENPGRFKEVIKFKLCTNIAQILNRQNPGNPAKDQQLEAELRVESSVCVHSREDKRLEF